MPRHPDGSRQTPRKEEIIPPMPFTCSICGEESTRICVRCTKDACDNHLCEKCLRCSDCCECEVTLSDAARGLPVASARSAIHSADATPTPAPEPASEPASEPEEPQAFPDPGPLADPGPLPDPEGGAEPGPAAL